MFKIVYEDSSLLVCVKESGVAVQTKRIGQKDMESMLKTYRMQKKEAPYIGVVHRLDQPVSGLMVFAKTKEAAAHLSRQMAEKTAGKYYYAVTDGIPEPKKGVRTDYLLRDGKQNVSKVVRKQEAGAKRAELSYEVLAQNETQAIVRILLATGRHHQIRVQMAHAGWPLVGDTKYNRKETGKTDGKPVRLCSYKLSFTHPVTKKKMEFEIENPFQNEI